MFTEKQFSDFKIICSLGLELCHPRGRKVALPLSNQIIIKQNIIDVNSSQSFFVTPSQLAASKIPKLEIGMLVEYCMTNRIQVQPIFRQAAYNNKFI